MFKVSGKCDVNPIFEAGDCYYLARMFNRSLIVFILAMLLSAACFAAESGESDRSGAKTAPASSNWRFEAGFAAGDPTPVNIIAGIGYKPFIMRVQGMGVHKGDNDYWCGFRGSLGVTFFRDLPFSMDFGVGGGYQFAEAPNGIHQALNKANGGIYVYPYNYEESADVSAEVWIHLFGFFTQIAYPVHFFMDHDTPTIIWRAGYLAEF